MPKVKLVTASQMRQIETLSSENGIDTDILMDKAGYELAKWLYPVLVWLLDLNVLL